MTLTDWEKVARELGDYDIRYPIAAVTSDNYVGDWVRSDVAAAEILRLRARVAALERVRDEGANVCRRVFQLARWDTVNHAIGKLSAAIEAEKKSNG